jgi:hypothetical protein
LRRALADGLAQVDGRRALLVVDRDELGGVLRGDQRLGNDHGDRLAHVPHGLAGERGAVRNDELLPAPAGKRRMLGQVADPLHVSGREHAEHARHGLGRGGVDRADIGEGVRGAHEIGLGLAGHGSIGRVASKPAHQRTILQARLVLRAAFNGLRIHLGFLCEENSIDSLGFFTRIGNSGHKSCHLRS